MNEEILEKLNKIEKILKLLLNDEQKEIIRQEEKKKLEQDLKIITAQFNQAIGNTMVGGSNE